MPVLGVFTALVSLALLIYAMLSVQCKGPILSTPYIFMSKAEREQIFKKTDKKAVYRQLAVISGSLALAFAALSAECLTLWGWPMFIMWAALLFAAVYAVVTGTKSVMGKYNLK